MASKLLFAWLVLTISGSASSAAQDSCQQATCDDTLSMLQTVPAKRGPEAVLEAGAEAEAELDPEARVSLLDPVARVEAVIDNTEALHPDASAVSLSSRLVQFYKSSLEARPHLTNGIVAYLITTLSDTSAQLIQGGADVFFKHGFDVKRNVALAMTASMYNGLILTSWLLEINKVLPGAELRWVMCKLAATQTILQPFVYVPFFFIVHGIFRGKSLVEIRSQIRTDYFALLFRLWSLFMPTRFLMFLIVPVQYQVLWDSSVAFIWQVALSLFSAKNGQSVPAQMISHKKEGTPMIFKPKACPPAADKGENEGGAAVSNDAGY